MKKLLFLVLLLPSLSHADILGDLNSNADVLLTTQAVAGSGAIIAVGTGTASNFTTSITSPTNAISFLGSHFTSVADGTTNFISLGSNVPLLNSTQTWTGANIFTGSTTLNGPLLARDSVGTLGQVIVSMGEGAAPMFVDPIVSQSNPALLQTSASINGSSNTVNVSNSSFSVTGSSVIVQNGSGANAVNIQDGGNSITVDGTVNTTGNLTVTPGTGTFPVSGNLAVTAGSGTFPVSGNVVVTAGSGTFPINGAVTVTPGTGTFNVGIATVTFNSISQPVNGNLTVTPGTGTFNIGTATVTFNGTEQPVYETRVATTIYNVAISSSGGLNAVGAVVALDVSRFSSASFAVGSVTATLTVLLEASVDGGTNWTAAIARNISPTTTSNTLSFSNTSGNFPFSFVEGAGVTNVRLRCSSYTSGVATATITANQYRGSPGVISTINTITNAVSSSQSGTWTMQPGNTPNTTAWLVNDRFSQPATLSVSSVAAVANNQIIASMTAVASQYHYITSIEIVAYATGTKTAAAAPVTITTTNLMNNPSFTFPTALTAGTNYSVLYQPTCPLRANALNQGTLITAPATPSVLWRINVFYFTGT